MGLFKPFGTIAHPVPTPLQFIATSFMKKRVRIIVKYINDFSKHPHTHFISTVSSKMSAMMLKSQFLIWEPLCHFRSTIIS